MEYTMNILESYVKQAPSNQTIVDIFKDEWSSTLPGSTHAIASPGHIPLFSDDRVEWLLSVFGSVKDQSILELGPLEGGHTYMMHQQGVSSITSVEANTHAFLKCLCVKEMLNMTNAHFKLGDFMHMLRQDKTKYDLVIASGVLYHMEEPIELIKLLSEITNKLFIWTHYYDVDTIKGRADLTHRFNAPAPLVYEGIEYIYATQAYKDALNWSGFCGGPMPVSKWVTRESILKALDHYGFTKISINFEDKLHSNGPSFAICASK